MAKVAVVHNPKKSAWNNPEKSVKGNPWGIVNIPLCDVITKIGTCCNFLLKYEPRIKDKEFHDKEQKIYTKNMYIFSFYVPKELSTKYFS